MKIKQNTYIYYEKVENFKCLGVNINQRNNMHNEIWLRLVSVNKEYHILRSILSRESKTKLYIIAYLRPIVMYACET